MGANATSHNFGANGHSAMKHHTIADICTAAGIAVDTARVRWKRAGFGSFDRNSVPSAEQWQVLFGKRTLGEKDANSDVDNVADEQADKARTVFADSERAEDGQSSIERTPSANTSRPIFREVAFQVVCAMIVLFHAALIAYDCRVLWGEPGAIAGGMAFLVVLACLLAPQSIGKDNMDNLLYFVWLIDGLAGFVHYPTFWAKASTGYAMGIRQFETGALAAIVCVISGAAIYFLKQPKT